MTFDQAAQIYLHAMTEQQAASVNAQRWDNWRTIGSHGTAGEYENCFVRAVLAETQKGETL